MACAGIDLEDDEPEFVLDVKSESRDDDGVWVAYVSGYPWMPMGVGLDNDEAVADFCEKLTAWWPPAVMIH